MNFSFLRSPESTGKKIASLVTVLSLSVAQGQGPEPGAEFLEHVIASHDKTAASSGGNVEERIATNLLKKENAQLKRELRAHRAELSKLRSNARRAEAMKNAEVSGQKALVEQLRNELAAARVKQAKSRQDLQEAHAEAGLWIQRQRATQDELAKFTLERMDAADQAKPAPVSKSKERRPSEKERRYDELLMSLGQVAQVLTETVSEHQRESK